MNDLSWLIYLAAVTDDLQNVCVLGLIVGFIALGITAALKSADDGSSGPIKGAAKRAFWPTIICAAIIVFTPSANTIYAIAASEYGEELAKTDTGNKAMQALNAWLDKQIAPEKEASDAD